MQGQDVGGLDEYVSKLDEAEKRLQRALFGLEAAASARLADNGPVSADPTEDDLLAAQAEVGKLRAENIYIAEKLNTTITRIKGMLEN